MLGRKSRISRLELSFSFFFGTKGNDLQKNTPTFRLCKNETISCFLTKEMLISVTPLNPTGISLFFSISFYLLLHFEVLLQFLVSGYNINASCAASLFQVACKGFLEFESKNIFNLY